MRLSAQHRLSVPRGVRLALRRKVCTASSVARSAKLARLARLKFGLHFSLFVVALGSALPDCSIQVRRANRRDDSGKSTPVTNQAITPHPAATSTAEKRK